MNKNNAKNEKLRELITIIAVIGGVSLALLACFFVPRLVRYIKNRPPSAHGGTLVQENKVVFEDKETGIGYIRCPSGIGANTLKEHPYLKIGETIVLYEIDFQDPKQFISESKEADFGSFVYRAENVAPITMESFAPVAAAIYKNDIQTGMFYSEEAAASSNGQIQAGTKYIDAIKQAFAGAEAELTGEATDKNSFYIRLLSKNFQGLYYEVLFFTDVNGVAYIKDYVTGKTVRSPDVLTAQMIG